ncbi:nSTAND1 domain-containing NTPase [Mastigocoleus testarum]|uniref:Uncharacterized protein n=1 Tax=Mastigocoleus testarum BC008 TaxID=371196 RepID=A0A0V7ZI58_9CYAN|nr:CHAT domain-containing protein [Mastigocoleus testarum]KST64060.1 hypothetical protein BC008_40415 [Mastigocoleus testarum BC008]KST64770.1 hypothetical protein BC008_41390 [Mastigocoleus testarum BC008]
MQILVSLKFGDGDFQSGFSENKNILNLVNTEGVSTELEIQLPPAPEIPVLYQKWQNQYLSLVNPLRMGFKRKQTTNFSWSECYQDCKQSARSLQTQLNTWLGNIKSQIEPVVISDSVTSDSNSEVIFVINTEQIKSQSTKDILHRLPWREWDYFPGNSSLEVALYLHESQLKFKQIEKVKPIDNQVFRRVKITSIFGDNQNIDIETDRELIEKLKQRGAELTVLSQPERRDFIKLWDEPCDVLFYSGHSQTDRENHVGSLKINPEDCLNPEEIRNTFREAIAKGLRLAIFNSCDGLGLAEQFANLGLPYIIVWREAVPDKIAQDFLKYFLGSFSQGKSLFASVRDARVKLQELTNKEDSQQQIPGVNWLPIICQNTLEVAPNWEDLGGLTGKLPNSPYKGLSAFKEKDAEIFFGRDRFIADLVDSANTEALVPVVGASGSGKSSLVFAGLVPRLREAGNVQVVSFRPGKNPFDALATALSSHLQDVISSQEGKEIEESNHRLKELELEVDLKANEQALCQFIENIISNTCKNNPLWKCRDVACYVSSKDSQVIHNSEPNKSGKQISQQNFSQPNIILIADQFEELYTLATEEQRQPFLDALLYAVKFAPNFTLVFTLRADFMGKVLDYQPMGEALQKYRPILLTSMNREELTAAIEKPAEKMKVELEEGLTAKLIDDLGKQPGRLPLLEFTLTQLWQKPNKWYLTHQAYGEIGGLEKALAKYADSVLDLLSEADKAKAERIFTQLVRPGEGTEDTKRVATREEINPYNWNLVKHLADERLVVTAWNESDRVETVEIIHEALIREWSQLQQWIDKDRNFRTWQESLRETMRQWEKANRDDGGLLRGLSLLEAEEKLASRSNDLSQGAKDFIQASIALRDREKQERDRRRKITITGLSSFSLVALILAGLAGLGWWSAAIGEINSLTQAADGLLRLNKQKATQTSVKAAVKMQSLPWVDSNTRRQVELTLLHIVPNVAAPNTLGGHAAAVNDVSYSPNGKIIASASTDNTIILWDASTGKQLKILTGHTNSVRGVSFSPDGKILASASWDKTAKLWDINTGKQIKTLQGHANELHDVSFSPDGNMLASASWDKTIKLWDINTGKKIRTLAGHQDLVHDVSFSPDGKVLVSASVDGLIKLWDISTGKQIKTLAGHKDEVYGVSFSPNGKILASASWDRSIKLWNINTGKPIQTFIGHKDGVRGVKFSPDGQILASASADKSVMLWDVKTGRKINTFTGHIEFVNRITFSPDSKILASASDDKTVRLWDIINGKEIQTLSGHTEDVKGISFSPDGKILASASSDLRIKLWDSSTKQTINTLTGHKDWVIDVSFSPDGETLASSGSDRTVKLWQTNTGKLIRTLRGHQDSVDGVSFSKNGKLLASASDDNTVKLWNPNTGKLIKTLTGHTASVRKVSFSPDSKILASGSWDNTIKLWDTSTAKLIKTLVGHQNSIRGVSFSPNGQMLASASGDKTVKLWNVNTGKEIVTLRGHQRWVRGVSFSPDNKMLASASPDGTVKIWDISSGKEIKSITGHNSWVYDVKFSPVGKMLASASGDRSVKLWKWDFDYLLREGCNFIREDFRINPPDNKEDKHMCNGINITSG